MCGIIGFVDYSDRLDEDFLNESLNKLRHRGPDGSGTFYEKKPEVTVALGHRRLTVIDPTEKGHQPFRSACGNYILVFNGTIYNYKELRESLREAGANFVSSSDTEVLLQAYILWPTLFLEKVNGIFAFCIFDKRRNKYILARDKMGVKPLFYYFDGRTLLFGSELRTFLKQTAVKSSIKTESLSWYLQYSYFPASHTIIQGVYKVNPGGMIQFEISNRSFIEEQYWRLTNDKISDGKNENTSSTLQNKIEESVKSRMVSDVPFGILLSGGYDSATVAAICKKFLTSGKLKTFCIGFREKAFNEAEDAARIAEFLGTDHHTLYFEDRSIRDTIMNIGRTFDEPMGDSGAISLLLAAKLAKPFVKVLLSAEGGDELFGGYPTYFKALKLARVTPILSPFIQNGSKRYLNILSQKNSLDVYRAMANYFTHFQAEKLTGSATPQIKHLDRGDGLNDLLNFDLNNYLINDLLVKADRCMMHYGIENRDPLLNAELIKYVHALPGNSKCPDNRAKFLLKQITHRYIPEHLMDRPKKGFSIPVGKWLSENLRDFTEGTIRSLNERNLLDQKIVSDTLIGFLNKPGSYYSRQLWVLLALELWLQEWYD